MRTAISNVTAPTPTTAQIGASNQASPYGLDKTFNWVAEHSCTPNDRETQSNL